jgi:hypothetical protein
VKRKRVERKTDRSREQQPVRGIKVFPFQSDLRDGGVVKTVKPALPRSVIDLSSPDQVIEDAEVITFNEAQHPRYVLAQDHPSRIVVRGQCLEMFPTLKRIERFLDLVEGNYGKKHRDALVIVSLTFVDWLRVCCSVYLAGAREFAVIDASDNSVIQGSLRRALNDTFVIDAGLCVGDFIERAYREGHGPDWMDRVAFKLQAATSQDQK